MLVFGCVGALVCLVGLYVAFAHFFGSRLSMIRGFRYPYVVSYGFLPSLIAIWFVATYHDKLLQKVRKLKKKSYKRGDKLPKSSSEGKVPQTTKTKKPKKTAKTKKLTTTAKAEQAKIAAQNLKLAVETKKLKSGGDDVFWVNSNGRIRGPMDGRRLLEEHQNGSIRKGDYIAHSKDGPWDRQLGKRQLLVHPPIRC